jgi:hypothetical protein
MTLGMRLLFYSLIGLLAGALCWPFTELVLFYQAAFPSLLFFSIVLGLVAGLFIGGVFGMSEGIIAHSRDRLLKGAIAGMIVGAVGGILGMISVRQRFSISVHFSSIHPAATGTLVSPFQGLWDGPCSAWLSVSPREFEAGLEARYETGCWVVS